MLDYLFSPGERAGFELKDTIPKNPRNKAQTQLEKICEEIYKLNTTEHERMVYLRECLHRVCKILNKDEIILPFSTSYDFTITPADGSNFFADNPEVDIIRSIPLEKNIIY